MAEDTLCPRTSAVCFLNAVVENLLEQVEILSHCLIFFGCKSTKKRLTLLAKKELSSSKTFDMTTTEKIALPADFVSEMTNLLGTDEALQLFEGLETPCPTSVRCNEAKGYDTDGEPVAWCRTGRYLSERPQFTLDPLLHAGCYYVQEAASMFVEQAFKAMGECPQRLLDLCASPGGKSTLWRSLLPDGALLVANEPLRQRAMVLAENLAKWGQPDVVVSNAYPVDFAPLTGFFDVIAADVPCSGEGMFRKDMGARNEWSVENVRKCAELQRSIIADVWPALRQGGYLVYSTCTFNRSEDEDNVSYICDELGAELIRLDVPEEWNVMGDTTGQGLPVYHFLPGKSRGEGFFLALLRKTSTTAGGGNRKYKKGVREQPLRNVSKLSGWLQNEADYKFYAPDDSHVAAVRKSLYEDVQRLRNHLKTVWAGVLLAEAKGQKWVPQQELALSQALAPEAFPRVELSLEEALAYLRRDAITVDAPRGYVIVTYQGHPLGFVNNLGARANNLYPPEWRIRKQLP